MWGAQFSVGGGSFKGIDLHSASGPGEGIRGPRPVTLTFGNKGKEREMVDL